METGPYLEADRGQWIAQSGGRLDGPRGPVEGGEEQPGIAPACPSWIASVSDLAGDRGDAPVAVAM